MANLSIQGKLKHYIYLVKLNQKKKSMYKYVNDIQFEQVGIMGYNLRSR